jgi:hypothetical protein
VQHVAFLSGVKGKHPVSTEVDPAIAVLFIIVRKQKAIHTNAIVAVAHGSAALGIPRTGRDGFLANPVAG